ncbi:MAG: polyprenyl synthetase family protein, partial [Oscillospiraceae bacterium]|nr:polyprenyl synthetase family protein [Oscillospiraceae bacterium]
RDDMLDEISTAEELGKPIGSDNEQGKTTFMTLFGLEGCEQKISALTEKAKSVCEIFEDPSFLIALADSMAVRRN